MNQVEDFWNYRLLGNFSDVLPWGNYVDFWELDFASLTRLDCLIHEFNVFGHLLRDFNLVLSTCFRCDFSLTLLQSGGFANSVLAYSSFDGGMIQIGARTIDASN